MDRKRLARLLRLEPADLWEALPLEQAYTGLWHLIVPVKTRAAVDEARPRLLISWRDEPRDRCYYHPFANA